MAILTQPIKARNIQTDANLAISKIAQIRMCWWGCRGYVNARTPHTTWHDQDVEDADRAQRCGNTNSPFENVRDRVCNNFK